MLETLISSKTRIKLLLRFFLNPGVTAYLRGLADEFDESTNSIRVELNRFEEAGMLVAENQGNKKMYKANSQHPLVADLHRILIKYIEVDTIISMALQRMGNLEEMYLTGPYAKGQDTGTIDMVFVGDVNQDYLTGLTVRGEELIARKLRFSIYGRHEWANIEPHKAPGDYLLIWKSN